MTIDELARVSGCTSRNIRNYQTLGLLPPPTVVGRTGYYNEGHLKRLRLIARLQGQGFSLAATRTLLDASARGLSLNDLVGFGELLAAPWSDEEPEAMTLEQLAAMFPEAVSDPALALRSVELGLVVPEEGGFRVPSPLLLRAGAELVASGVPLAAAQEELAALRADMERIAVRFVQLFERFVWQPFVDAGMPPEQLGTVTEALARMRPLAATSVQATLAQAMPRQVAQSAAALARRLSESTADRVDATDPASKEA
ncbi:MAG: MerR family transcriptional regulator [Actinobacteria bacterium]|nr:MerR family transcriptional regulator [Actinomycetota bacterium]